MTGFKDFSDGAPLTASDIDEYLMQGVLVFDSASARDTALSGNNREGRVAYLKDTNTTVVYNGSSWSAIGAASDLSVADISSTAGTPTTSTYTVDGVNYTAYKWTNTAGGTVTFSRAGNAKVLVVGGGGGGNNAFAGGGGGGVFQGIVEFGASAYAITVGDGGAGSNGGGAANGGASSIGSLARAGGGTGGAGSPSAGAQPPGATGGAGGGSNGGGGAGGAAAGGTGGAGITSTMNDGSTSVEYGKGGDASSTSAGAANTGNGGGGGQVRAGGSGLVIIRVRT